jgi:rhamnosyltransferase subunit B
MKILLTVLGSSGDINPMIGIGLGLKKRGHEIYFATSPFFKKIILQNEFEFIAIYPDLNPSNKRLKEIITDPIRGSEYLHKDFLFPNLDKSYRIVECLLDELEIDMILTSTLCYFTPIACEVKKKPYISICLSPMLFFSKFDAPILPFFPALKNLQSHPNLIEFILKMIFSLSKRWLKPYYELRESVGIPKTNNPLFRSGFSPHGTIALFSEHFGKPQIDWPKNVYQCGFNFFDKPPIDTDVNSEIHKFIEKNNNPILFTLGTTAVMNPGKLFDIFFDAQKKTGIPSIVLTGRENFDKYKSFKSNSLLIVDYLPYSEIMPHCGLIIHQGGVGTTAQTMRSGIPSIILPNCNDQFDNANRVERLGISKTIPYKKLTASKLADLIIEVYNSSEYKAQASKYGNIILNENATELACNFIELSFKSTPTNS